MATKSFVRLGGYYINANRDPVRIYTQYADANLNLRLTTELVKKDSK